MLVCYVILLVCYVILLVCYVIPQNCTVDGKLTLREHVNSETFERALRFDKMEYKCVEFKSTSAQPETSAVNFETLFSEVKY
jgi:hypothetical protein